jgi:Ca2+-binding EF-hand superfamily protein
MRAKPAETDLTEVFKTIDTDHDGYISFSEYVDFIRKYLGLGIQNEPEVKHDVGEVHKPDNVSTEEWDFINEIWGELKTYFDKYDTGAKGYLTEDNMKKFVVEVLQENTQRELDYIFWNFFRVDPNTDRKTEFNEFVSMWVNIGSIHSAACW